MVNLTIRIIEVSGVINTIDGLGNPVSVRNVVFKVAEWPDLGPWTLSIPLGSTKAQAKAELEGYVRDLASNLHEFYGLEWSLTV